MSDANLKNLTAKSLKWNFIDRIAQMALYGIVGVVLARELSPRDFGLVGTVLMFQAFASLFVDSGFSYALIQRKEPSRLDYSTILWFNIGVAGVAYIALWWGAVGIAWWYDDQVLVGMARVMFLSFIFNAASIVQTNRFMKEKNVAPVAIANTVGLSVGGIVAIILAINLPESDKAWAVVWQLTVNNLVRAIVLWLESNWRPLWQFSWTSLKSFMGMGTGMMTMSLLNTVFLNIYTFVIGTFTGMSKLGYYSQADKWSKMGITSLTGVMTSSFLPTLSDVQDDPDRFSRATMTMNRSGSYLLMPAMGFLIVMATPIFHVLFGTKWDLAIAMFQLLLLRGVFTTLTSMYNNYIIALGHPRLIVAMEVLRDFTALAAMGACLPWIDDTLWGNPVGGIELLLWGQLAASTLAWGVTLWFIAPMTGRTRRAFLVDSAPYFLITLTLMATMWGASMVVGNDWLLLVVQGVIGAGGYLAWNNARRDTVQSDILRFLKKK